MSDNKGTPVKPFDLDYTTLDFMNGTQKISELAEQCTKNVSAEELGSMQAITALCDARTRASDEALKAALAAKDAASR